MKLLLTLAVAGAAASVAAAALPVIGIVHPTPDFRFVLPLTGGAMVVALFLLLLRLLEHHAAERSAPTSAAGAQ